MSRRYRGRDSFKKARFALETLCKLYRLFPMKTRKKLLERHRFTRGMLGCGIRYALLKSIAKQCGDNVFIGQGVYLLNAQNLILGSNISIHPMCYIECGSGADNQIRIGDNVSIAHGVTLIVTSHTYVCEETDIIRDMPGISRPIVIESNVWIGAKATVLLGTTIRSGCVIGAHSLVNKDTDPDGIYAGVPAVRKKDRR